MDYWANQRGIPKSKLTFGMPTYGFYYKNVPLYKKITKDDKENIDIKGYSDLKKIFTQPGWERTFDKNSQSAYYISPGQQSTICCDDPETIKLKTKWAKDNGYAGIFLKGNTYPYRVDLIMATMTMTQKREDVVDFSTPYFEVGQGLLTRSDSDIQNFHDLKGRKVAVLEGTQAFHTLRRMQPDCFLIIVDSYAKGIETVLSKETEALCSDHLLLMGLLHEHADMSMLSLVEETFAPDPYAVAMRENESSLRDAVNASLMKLWEESIWQDTYETWFGLGSMYGHDLIFRIGMIPE